MVPWLRRRAGRSPEITLDQGDARALHGDIGPGAHRDADLRLRQRRGVVDPVSRHGDNMPLGLQTRTTSPFCAGRTSASTWSMPKVRATASAVVRLSPVSMTICTPSARKARIAQGSWT